jgi:hypothetical protein
MYRYKIEVKNLNGIVTNLASFESKSEYINWIDKQESEERAFGIYFNKTEVTEEEFLSNLGELTPLYIEDFEVENSDGTITKMIRLKKAYSIEIEDQEEDDNYILEKNAQIKINQYEKDYKIGKRIFFLIKGIFKAKNLNKAQRMAVINQLKNVREYLFEGDLEVAKDYIEDLSTGEIFTEENKTFIINYINKALAK